MMIELFTLIVSLIPSLSCGVAGWPALSNADREQTLCEPSCHTPHHQPPVEDSAPLRVEFYRVVSSKNGFSI